MRFISSLIRYLRLLIVDEVNLQLIETERRVEESRWKRELSKITISFPSSILLSSTPIIYYVQRVYIRKSDGSLATQKNHHDGFSSAIYFFPPLFLERVIFKSEKRKQW